MMKNSGYGVVYTPDSLSDYVAYLLVQEFKKDIIPYYNQCAIYNSQMWLHQYCLSVGYILRILISSYLSFPVIVLKASHPIPTAIFIICYKLLPDFLSLVFSLIRGHNQG